MWPSAARRGRPERQCCWQSTRAATHCAGVELQRIVATQRRRDSATRCIPDRPVACACAPAALRRTRSSTISTTRSSCHADLGTQVAVSPAGHTGTASRVRLLERADRVIVSTPELDAALPGRRADVVLAHDSRRVGVCDGRPRRVEPVASRLDRLGGKPALPGSAARGARTARARGRGASWRSSAQSPVAWPGELQALGSARAKPTRSRALRSGLMPLPDSPYTQAKAGFKLFSTWRPAAP